MTKQQAIGHIDKAHKKVFIPLGDLLLGKLMSKKLTVFIIATFFTINAYLTGAEWVIVAEWYFASQGLVDIAKVIKGKPKTEDESH